MNLAELQKQVKDTIAVLKIADKERRAAELEAQTQAPDFWNNPETAEEIFQKLKSLQKQVATWRNLENEVRDLRELEAEVDDSLVTEFENSVAAVQEKFARAETDLFLAGKYDNAAATLTLLAGTGGTDAQDWTEMLLRMYSRFCEKQGWQTEILALQAGDEAGIKSVTLEVRGENAFGLLRRERGTHRLIRLSPFNSKNLRQTGFAGVDVAPILSGKSEIKIDEKDLRVDTFRSSGHGGQHVNTTDSAVRITHLPTGTVAQCRNGRSQLANREKAMQILVGKLSFLEEEKKQQELAAARGGKVAADFGSQIRTVTLHPYQQVKDHRTGQETGNTENYLAGDLLEFIETAMRAGF